MWLGHAENSALATNPNSMNVMRFPASPAGHSWPPEPRFASSLCRYRGAECRVGLPGRDSLSGNSSDHGHTKNYGDPSPVIGMVVRYEPGGLEIDIGAALTEALLEPLIHEGVDQNIAISVAWQF